MATTTTTTTISPAEARDYLEQHRKEDAKALRASDFWKHFTVLLDDLCTQHNWPQIWQPVNINNPFWIAPVTIGKALDMVDRYQRATGVEPEMRQSLVAACILELNKLLNVAGGPVTNIIGVVWDFNNSHYSAMYSKWIGGDREWANKVTTAIILDPKIRDAMEHDEYIRGALDLDACYNETRKLFTSYGKEAEEFTNKLTTSVGLQQHCRRVLATFPDFKPLACLFKLSVELRVGRLPQPKKRTTDEERRLPLTMQEYLSDKGIGDDEQEEGGSPKRVRETTE